MYDKNGINDFTRLSTLLFLIPSQEAKLHGLASCAPCSFARQAPMHVRDRSISPSPQVVLQIVHELQCDQPILNSLPYIS